MDRISENNMDKKLNNTSTNIDKLNEDIISKITEPSKVSSNATNFNLEASSANHDNALTNKINSQEGLDKIKSYTENHDEQTCPKHIEVNLKDKISATNTLNLGIIEDTSFETKKDINAKSRNEDTVLYKEKPTFTLQEDRKSVV